MDLTFDYTVSLTLKRGVTLTGFDCIILENLISYTILVLVECSFAVWRYISLLFALIIYFIVLITLLSSVILHLGYVLKHHIFIRYGLMSTYEWLPINKWWRGRSGSENKQNRRTARYSEPSPHWGRILNLRHGKKKQGAGTEGWNVNWKVRYFERKAPGTNIYYKTVVRQKEL